MNISLDGINQFIVTFNSQEDINPGCLVTVIDDLTVKQATENETFIGLCISSKNGIAAIQISGYATIKIKTLDSTKYGRQFFVADEDGSLKLTESSNPLAVPLNVVSIDKNSSTLGVLL